MSITHEQARRLIQFKADEALGGVENRLLEEHLGDCQECRNFAASIRELEATLPRLLHRRWNQHPLPYLAGKAFSRKPIQLHQSILFATRILAMSVICIAFMVNIWQATQSGRQRSNPPSAEIPMIPTPSVPSPATKILDPTCEPILHEVQQNDTLESLAQQYSVTIDEILSANQLRTTVLSPGEKLSIPGCSPAPSGTPNSIASTFPALVGTTTLTPLNNPTQ